MALRHLLRDDDFNAQEQLEIFSLAAEMKKNPYDFRPLAGPQAVAVLFDKPSSRTRFSFDAGIAQLGGHPMITATSSIQIGHSESIGDTAQVLSRYTSAIVWRTYAQSNLEQMAKYATVPVINALSDEFHPCQALTDIFTIQEKKGDLAGLQLAYIGDATNNMSNSLILSCLTAGIDVTVCAPDNLYPDSSIVHRAQEISHVSGANLRVENNPQFSVVGADVIYTDTWASMGYDEEKIRERKESLQDFQVNAELLSRADSGAIVMHCLPAHRNEEITDEVIDGPQSVVFDEAENRLHVQKAILTWLIQQQSH